MGIHVSKTETYHKLLTFNSPPADLAAGEPSHDAGVRHEPHGDLDVRGVVLSALDMHDFSHPVLLASADEYSRAELEAHGLLEKVRKGDLVRWR